MLIYAHRGASIDFTEGSKAAYLGALAQGGRIFNPGFHLSFDLDNMLLVAESTAKSAILREESRGGHTRDDFPVMNTKWRGLNNISSFNGKEVIVKQQELPFMPKELFSLFDVHELEKYMSQEEIDNILEGVK